MAWEKRGSGLYYYRARRQGGMVVKEYVGAGPLAELMAGEDAQAQAEALAARQRDRAERERLATLETPIEELCRLADLAARAALVAAGYHQHDRGEWRRQREWERRETQGDPGRDRRPDPACPEG